MLCFAPAAANATITQIGGPGAGNGTYDQPGAVTVDPSGNVYVLDTHRGTLQEFDKTGHWVAGTSVGAFVRLPTHGVGGIAYWYGPAGATVFVADPDDHQLSAFIADTAHHSFISDGAEFTSGSYVSVAVAPVSCVSGSVNGQSYCESFIYTLDNSGKLIQWNSGTGSACETGQLGSESTSPAGIHDQIAVGPYYSVYVAAAASQRLLQFDGSPYGPPTCSGSGTLGESNAWPLAGVGGFGGYATGVAVNGADLYVGDDNLAGTAYVRHYGIDSYGNLLGQTGRVRVGGTAGGLAADGSGNGFAAGGSSSNSVVRIDQAPDPVISATPGSGLTSQTATFDGSQSGSFSGITNYLWNIGGATSTASAFARQFNSVGSFPVTLTVKGGNGQSASTTLNYSVGNSSAVLSNPGSALTGQSVTFDGSGSQIPYSSITDYAWDFDGSSSYGVDGGGSPTVSHAFSAPGVYPVQLRVTRAGGRVDTASGQIVVLPTPPPGPVGVSINNGDYATNTANVQLNLVWPAGASHALISNDGGFDAAGGTRTVPVAPTVPWTLRSQGSERLPKTVWVRFPDGPTGVAEFTDDIILDTTNPVIRLARSVGGGHAADVGPRFLGRLSSYNVRVHAAEGISGISAAQFRPRHYAPKIRHTADWPGVSAAAGSGGIVSVTFTDRTRRGILNLNRVITVRMSSPPGAVRVRSAAGNWSAWHQIN